MTNVLMAILAGAIIAVIIASLGTLEEVARLQRRVGKLERRIEPGRQPQPERTEDLE